MSASPTKGFLSTGQAAELCSVTPDTVLKWIQAGKVPASRTPGGHHRIPYDAILKFINSEKSSIRSEHNDLFQYCWEYNSKNGKVPDDCLKCVVYRSRTRRCYEMSDLPDEAGHVRLFCQNSCEDCEYYKMVREQNLNVLVVTDQNKLKSRIDREAKDVDFNIQITDCEYRCSMMVEKFRPDYIAIDCAIGTERSREFAQHLCEDPRLPFVRIILAGSEDELPKECDKLVFAFIRRPFSAEILADIIGIAKS
jgi:excisionase family DNA binding protein